MNKNNSKSNGKKVMPKQSAGNQPKIPKDYLNRWETGGECVAPPVKASAKPRKGK